MTEEEKNTNQKTEDKDDKDDDPEFKVVVPKPNRVTMEPEQFKEQPDYLKNFANFYIAEFNEKDLEIINLYDTDHNMVDINDYLLNNIHFTRKNLVKHVLQYHDYNFQNILDEMVKKEGIDPKQFKTYEDWSNWYEKRRSEIPHTLS